MSNLTRAYQCDTQGVLLGETLVQEDPQEPGALLFPPGCVLVAPPTFDTQTQVAIFLEGAWDVRDLPSQPEPSPHRASATLVADDLIPPAPPVVSVEMPTPANMLKTEEHEIAVIVEGQWAVVADCRDTVYCLADGSTALGHTPSNDALSAPPSPALPDDPADPADE